MKDQAYWRNIVAEADGERLASEARTFLRSIEPNVPAESKAGFDSLENVLLDVVRHAEPETIRTAGRLIGAPA